MLFGGSRDPYSSIKEGLNTFSPGERQVLLLCFSSLAVVFKEIDSKKSYIGLEKENKSSVDKSLVYSRIPKIPFAAARMLWLELLGFKRDHRKVINSNLCYWETFVTKEHRNAFLEVSRSYKRNSILNGAESLNIPQSMEDPEPHDNYEAVINFIRDNLVKAGLIDIIYVNQSNVDDEDYDSDKSPPDDSSAASYMSNTSMSCKDHLSRPSKNSFREKNSEFLLISSDLHSVFGQHLCEIHIANGGFELNSFENVDMKWNAVMVAACERQQKRFESLKKKADDALTYSLRLLPSHMMRAEEDISKIASILQSTSFVSGRVTILGIVEGSIRHQRDCEELWLRELVRTRIPEDEFKIYFMNSLGSMRSFLLKKYPIVQGNDSSTNNGFPALEVGKSLHMLASNLASKGFEDESISIYNDALRYKKLSLGTDEKNILRTLRRVAKIYMKKRDYEVSLGLFNDVLYHEKRLFGDRDKQISNSLEAVAVLNCIIGEHKKAIGLYQSLLGLMKDGDGKDVPEAADIYYAVGILHETLRENVTATICFREAIKIRSGSSGVVDSLVINSYYKMGDLYLKQKIYDKALKCYQEVLHLEKDKEKSVQALDRMTIAYLDMGNFGIANQWYQNSVLIKVRSHGYAGIPVIETHFNMALELYDRKQYDRAIKAFNDSHDVAKLKYGEKHEKIADILQNLGFLYVKKENNQMAASYFKEALEINREKLGSDHIKIVGTLYALANVLYSNEFKDEAMAYYEEGISIEKSLFGTNNMKVASSCNMIGIQYLNKGDFDEAMNYFVDTVRIRRAILGKEHISVAETLHNIGLVYKEKSEFDSAIKRMEEALRIMKDVLGEKNPKVAETIYDIAMVQYQKGDLKLALDMHKQAYKVYKHVGLSDKNPRVSNTIYWIKYLKRKIRKEIVETKNAELAKSTNLTESFVAPVDMSEDLNRRVSFVEDETKNE